jgi:hypothetical protein
MDENPYKAPQVNQADVAPNQEAWATNLKLSIMIVYGFAVAIGVSVVWFIR